MGMVQKLADVFGVRLSAMLAEDWDGRELLVGTILPKAPKPAHAPLLGRIRVGDARGPDIINDRVSLLKKVADRHPDAHFLQVEGSCMSRVCPGGCLDPRRTVQRLGCRGVHRRSRLRDAPPAQHGAPGRAVTRLAGQGLRERSHNRRGRAHGRVHRHSRLVSAVRGDGAGGSTYAVAPDGRRA